jgi:hypothetical protein
MVKWNQFYTGKFLSAEKLGKQRLRGKIVSVEPITTNEGKPDERTQVGIHIDTSDFTILLNKGNASSLADAFGEDIERWNGKKVSIYTIDTQFNGKRVKGLKVEPQK